MGGPLEISGLNVEPVAPTAPHRVLRPVMRQTWRDLTFLHWPYEPAVVRRFIPSDLHLDLYDGVAWIGLVPFAIEGLTLPHVPAVPWLSAFPETNVRTYVIDRHGRRGIWFFSLDAARLLAVLGARALYALPYFWARMNVTRVGPLVRYTSARLTGSGARSGIEIRVGDAISRPSELEVFLTARFRLYARRGKRLLEADVEHPPWRLRRAGVVRLEQNLLEAGGLPVANSEPLAHFGGRVDVLVGAPHTV
jgi:uncharacterized protein YqjF (DUF2071 family)